MRSSAIKFVGKETATIPFVVAFYLETFQSCENTVIPFKSDSPWYRRMLGMD